MFGFAEVVVKHELVHDLVAGVTQVHLATLVLVLRADDAMLLAGRLVAVLFPTPLALQQVQAVAWQVNPVFASRLCSSKIAQ